MADVVELGGVLFELELKGYGEAQIDAVLDVVRQAGVLGRVEFTGSNLLLVAMLRHKEPRAITGLFSAPRQAWMSAEVYERTTSLPPWTSPPTPQQPDTSDATDDDLSRAGTVQSNGHG